MAHALARCKVRRLRVNIKTSVLNRLNKRIAYLGQRDRPQRALLSTPQKRHARFLEQIVHHAGQAGKHQGKTALLAIGQARGILVSQHLLVENGQGGQLLDRCRLRLVDGKQNAFPLPELLETLVNQPAQRFALCTRRLDRHPAKRRAEFHRCHNRLVRAKRIGQAVA